MPPPSRASATKKHVILFLAANSHDTDRLALGREARSIHVELKRSGYRERFEFVLLLDEKKNDEKMRN